MKSGKSAPNRRRPSAMLLAAFVLVSLSMGSRLDTRVSGAELSAHGPAAAANSDSFTVHFPHFAAGGGYTTTFSFLNSGATTAAGWLYLFDSSGDALTPIQMTISPRGVNSYRVGGSAMRTGWAKLEGVGGDVTGVATYHYSEFGIVQTAVGVFPSSPTLSALIPVDNDVSAGAATAYAIANPGTGAAEISLRTYSENGSLLDDNVTIRLEPGQQIARYLHEDLPARSSHFGSMELASLNGEPFIAMALIQNQRSFTALPVITR